MEPGGRSGPEGKVGSRLRHFEVLISIGMHAHGALPPIFQSLYELWSKGAAYWLRRVNHSLRVLRNGFVAL